MLTNNKRTELLKLCAENKRLKVGKDILKSTGLLRQGNEIGFKFVR